MHLLTVSGTCAGFILRISAARSIAAVNKCAEAFFLFFLLLWGFVCFGGKRYGTVSYDDGRIGGGEFSLRSPGVPRQSHCPAGDCYT